MAGRLEGKRVLVTGAAGGLGSATAAALRLEGARVAGMDLREGPGVTAGDVTDPRDAARVVGQVVATFGGLDVLINNAGVGWGHVAGQFPGPELRQMVEVNLFGAWNMIAAALEPLLAARGHVVNVASGIAVVPMPYGAAYSVSKSGLVGLSGVLRVEYRGRLDVTTVYPGYLATGIHDRNVAQGYGLAGILPEDRLDRAAKVMVRVCKKRPREASTSLRTAASLWLARRWPAAVEAAVHRHLMRHLQRRDPPAFLPGGWPGADRTRAG